MSYLQGKYSRMVDETNDLINSAQKFTQECQDIISTYYDTDLTKILEAQEKNSFEEFFNSLRWQIKTGLIKIVVTGEFATGKSFLVSGLIEKLQWLLKQDPKFADEFESDYFSLLPVSPNQTTSCPLEIIPAINTNIPQLEVTFNDNPEHWVKLPINPKAKDPYDEIHNLLQSYVTSLEETKRYRTKEHRSKNVVKARLHIPDMNIPASFYDLPGLGGIDINGQRELYQKTFEEAMITADMIIYLSSCERELGENELEMLRFIENVTKERNVPILFVLTKSDKQSSKNITDIKYGNRRYFKKYFSNGDSIIDSKFFNEGFLPISAALEAEAFERVSLNNIEQRWSEDKAAAKIAASGMPELRKRIQDHLATWSGPAHLRHIVIELGNLLLQVQRELESFFETENEPIDNIQQMIQDLYNERNKLDIFHNQIEQDMNRRATGVKKIAFRDNPKYKLIDKLATGLKPLIESLDVLKKDVIHQIERDRDKLIREWLNQPDGLYEDIADALKRYTDDTIISFNAIDDEKVKQSILKGRARNLLQPTATEIALPPVPPSDAEAGSSILAQGISLMAGIGAGGAAAAFTVAVPVAIFLSFAAIGLGGIIINDRRQLREKTRLSLLEQIPSIADDTIKQIETNFDNALIKYMGNVLNLTNESVTENTNKVAACQMRLEGDYKSNVVRVKKLQILLESFSKLEKKIDLFVKYAISS